MSKADNIHHTIKWKKKRKNHFGDKCHKKDCGICSPHKKPEIGNSSKWKKKKHIVEDEKFYFEKEYLD